MTLPVCSDDTAQSLYTKSTKGGCKFSVTIPSLGFMCSAVGERVDKHI